MDNMDELSNYLTKTDDPLENIAYDEPQQYTKDYKRINIYNKNR